MDEAGALQSMGYEVLSARPFEGNNRLWACRMCSKYPIVRPEFISIDLREFTKALEKKTGRPLDIGTYLHSKTEYLKNAFEKIEYLKLGNDINKKASEHHELYFVYVVFERECSHIITRTCRCNH